MAEIRQDERVDKTLQHFGIPGMKWGIRRSPEQLAKRAAQKQEKKLHKADLEFAKPKNVQKLTVDLTNKIYADPKLNKQLTDKMIANTKKLAKFENVDLIERTNSRIFRDFADAYLKTLPEAYSPSKSARLSWGTIEFEGGRGPTFLKPVLVEADIKHSSDEFDIGFTGKFKLLQDGTLELVEDVSLDENLNHVDVDAYLEHWGIPGMKWGIRRAVGPSGRVSGGGKAPKGSEDYQKARALKKKGYKNLSDQELKALTTRMNLERNFRDLKSSDAQKGLDFVKTATAIGTTLASAYALSQTPLGQKVISGIGKKLKKG